MVSPIPFWFLHYYNLHRNYTPFTNICNELNVYFYHVFGRFYVKIYDFSMFGMSTPWEVTPTGLATKGPGPSVSCPVPLWMLVQTTLLTFIQCLHLFVLCHQHWGHRTQLYLTLSEDVCSLQCFLILLLYPITYFHFYALCNLFHLMLKFTTISIIKSLPTLL